MVKPEILTFKVKFDLEGQSQSPSKTIGNLNNVFCTSGPNLVILAWMGDKLWCGQPQNRINLDIDFKFDLGDQGWLLHKTIKILTKPFCIFDPNLVIIDWTGPELSCGQATKWLTHRLTHIHTHTHTGNDKLASSKNAFENDVCETEAKYFVQAEMG